MNKALKSLLVFLVVAAFGVATVGTAAALPCTDHRVQALHESDSGGQFISGCGPVASEFTRHPAPQHETHDQCLHPCCVSATTATLVEVARPYLALRIESDAIPIPDGKLLTGIAVTPLTGPPKLSA
jgi:hypothetical protein